MVILTFRTNLLFVWQIMLVKITCRILCFNHEKKFVYGYTILWVEKDFTKEGGNRFMVVDLGVLVVLLFCVA